MKSIFCVLLIWIFSVEVFAQNHNGNTIETEVQHRIYLDEKMNLPLKTLPNMLLEAFCDGRLKAYFPNRPDVQMSYYDFLYYFSIPEPVIDPTGLGCPSAQCKLLDYGYIEAFSEAIDFAEMQLLDQKTSAYHYQTLYFRLVFPAKYTLNAKEYYGPVFRYEDVIKVFPNAVFFNRQNDAAKFTLKHIFSTRNFNVATYPAKDMFGRLQKDSEVVEKEKRAVWEE